ncbi:hypothetical protein OV450_8376, partial [Actinobacteria bacterium OV450]
MSERVVPGGVGALVSLSAADALWAALTAGSAVPAASAVLTRPPAWVGAGYVVLGARVVAAVRADDGRWGVAEVEVRQAALGLNSVGMDGRDLVRIGPFGGAPKRESGGGTLLGWRGRVAEELRGTAGCGRAARCEEGRLCDVAGSTGGGCSWSRRAGRSGRGGCRGRWSGCWTRPGTPKRGGCEPPRLARQASPPPGTPTSTGPAGPPASGRLRALA